MCYTRVPASSNRQQRIRIHHHQHRCGCCCCCCCVNAEHKRCINTPAVRSSLSLFRARKCLYVRVRVYVRTLIGYVFSIQQLACATNTTANCVHGFRNSGAELCSARRKSGSYSVSVPGTISPLQTHKHTHTSRTWNVANTHTNSLHTHEQ